MDGAIIFMADPATVQGAMMNGRGEALVPEFPRRDDLRDAMGDRVAVVFIQYRLGRVNNRLSLADSGRSWYEVTRKPDRYPDEGIC
jgi:hypothetical protein